MGPYPKISSGNCGDIYSQVDKANNHTLKRAKNDECAVRLWNDYLCQAKVYETLRKYEPFLKGDVVRVPRPLYFVSKNDRKWWDKFGEEMSSQENDGVGYGYGLGRRDTIAHGITLRAAIASLRPVTMTVEPQAVLASERIVPVNRAMRERIVEEFCLGGESRRRDVICDAKNVNCLARVYLGSRSCGRRRSCPRTITTSNGNSVSSSNIHGLPFRQPFTLCDFPLHLDQIPALDLDPVPLATAIAQALAILHWDLHLDSCGIEFVLGGSRARELELQPLSSSTLVSIPPGSSTVHAVTNPTKQLQLWMLDFDRVGPIAMDEDGVERAVVVFFAGGSEERSWFPRPLAANGEDQKLWEIFEKAYLETACKLRKMLEVQGRSVEWRGLPEKFVTRVYERQAEVLRSTDQEEEEEI